MKKVSIFILLFFSTLEFVNGQSQQKEAIIETVELPQMVYPKYRRWMSPNIGETPRFVSPSLQWPSKKNEIFELRIAKDKAFTKELIKIKEAYVNKGPVMKRFRAASMGRASKLRRPSSHLTIILTTE